jgi:hypothetical protein
MLSPSAIAARRLLARIPIAGIRTRDSITRAV